MEVLESIYRVALHIVALSTSRTCDPANVFFPA